jgi:multidomain signaling protein FimX
LGDIRLADTAAVPMLVLARTEDFVSVVNSTLRNAGLAVHCHWARDSNSMADMLANTPVEMILAFVSAEPAEAINVIQIRDRNATTVPVIFVRERIDEELIAAAIHQGARDVVTLASRARLQAVVSREVAAYRAARELASFKTAAKQSHEQVKAIIADTADAIAYVQEGIVVDANQAWCSAFGHANNEQLVGHPFMDLLDARTQSTFKTALSACLQNKWTGQPLAAAIQKPDGNELQLEFRLARGDYDGEPAVYKCRPYRQHLCPWPCKRWSQRRLKVGVMSARNFCNARFLSNSYQRFLKHPLKAFNVCWSC